MKLPRVAVSLLLFVVACSDEPADRPSVDAGPRSADAGALDGGDAVDMGTPGADQGVTGGDAGMGALCPPSGPTGTTEGSTAPDVMLLDCEDDEVRLHSLCEAPVSWVVVYAEWCPVCRTFARDQVESLWQTYEPQGLKGYVVVSANASYEAPDAELCAEVRERYGFTIPVLYDPTGALLSGLDVRSNAVNVLFTEGMQIEWKGRYQDDEVAGRLEGLF